MKGGRMLKLVSKRYLSLARSGGLRAPIPTGPVGPHDLKINRQIESVKHPVAWYKLLYYLPGATHPTIPQNREFINNVTIRDHDPMITKNNKNNVIDYLIDRCHPQLLLKSPIDYRRGMVARPIIMYLPDMFDLTSVMGEASIVWGPIVLLYYLVEYGCSLDLLRISEIYKNITDSNKE